MAIDDICPHAGHKMSQADLLMCEPPSPCPPLPLLLLLLLALLLLLPLRRRLLLLFLLPPMPLMLLLLPLLLLLLLLLLRLLLLLLRRLLPLPLPLLLLLLLLILSPMSLLLLLPRLRLLMLRRWRWRPRPLMPEAVLPHRACWLLCSCKACHWAAACSKQLRYTARALASSGDIEDIAPGCSLGPVVACPAHAFTYDTASGESFCAASTQQPSNSNVLTHPRRGAGCP